MPVINCLNAALGMVDCQLCNIGPYAQQGFATDWLGTLAYEHRWRFDPLTELRYGVTVTRRVYDGAVENTLMLTVGLTQRF